MDKIKYCCFNSNNNNINNDVQINNKEKNINRSDSFTKTINTNKQTKSIYNKPSLIRNYGFLAGSKDGKKKPKASWKDIVKHLKPYIAHKKNPFMKALLITIISKGLITISPYFLKLVVDAIIAHEPLAYSLALIGGFALTRIFGYIIQEYRQIELHDISNDVVINFTNDMLKYLYKIDFGSFKISSTHILNSFTKSINGIDGLKGFLVSTLISTLIEFGMVSAFIFLFLGPKYALNIFLTYAVYIYMTKKITNYRQ